MIYLSFEVNKELDYLDLISFIGIAYSGTCCAILDNKCYFRFDFTDCDNSDTGQWNLKLKSLENFGLICNDYTSMSVMHFS